MTILKSKGHVGAFSGLLAAAIGQMNGIRGRPGWAWIFIIVSLYQHREILLLIMLKEGIVSIIFGLFLFLVFPKGPTMMSWLTIQEKAHVEEILKADGIMSKDPEGDMFSWKEVFRGFALPQVWFSTPIFFGLGMVIIQTSKRSSSNVSTGTTLYGLS